jgi:hypothetical protein
VKVNRVRYLDIEEFRELGYLQEVNRLFLHPLGLALEVVVENGEERLGGIWDHRDDPDGIAFAPGLIDPEKAARVRRFYVVRCERRQRRLGWSVQPVETEEKL